MISAVNASLRALLAAALPQTVPVRFDPPAPAERTAERTVRLFLYDLREDTRGRLADWQDVHDGAGRIVGRRRPDRRYELSYLVTCTGATVEEEHELLGTALTALHGHDFLPPDVLAGGLAGTGRAGLTVAAPEPRVEPHELWPALGVPPRLGFDLRVTAAVPAGPVLEVPAPPSTVRLSSASS